MPQDLSLYYRQQIKKQMNTQNVVDLNKLAAEQWEEAITLPIALLGGVVSKISVV